MQGLITAFNFLLQLENERLQNTLEVYKKSLKEKSEEIESKNETISQMMEERMRVGELDTGLDDIDVGQLLDVNLGAAHIRDLLGDKTLLNCDLLDSPGCEVESFNSKVGVEPATSGRPGVVGRLKVQKMEKMGFQNHEDRDMNRECNLEKVRVRDQVGHQVKRYQGKSQRGQGSNDDEEARSNSKRSQDQRRKRGRKTSFQKQLSLQTEPLALTPSRNSFNGSPATSSSSGISPTPPIKKLKGMTNPLLPLTKKSKEKSTAPSNSSLWHNLCTEPRTNRLKIGMMSTRVGTIKNYSSSNTSSLNKSDCNSASDVVNMQTYVVSNQTSTSTTVVCPHCPKQFPRGGAWKIPQHISSAHPSSSPHLAPRLSSSPPSSTTSSIGLAASPLQGKSPSSREAFNQRQKGNPPTHSPPFSTVCKQCGEKLPYPSAHVAHRWLKSMKLRTSNISVVFPTPPFSPRALHSARPPWKCLGCKLPLPSLHIFIDHVRGSHKVFLIHRS